MEDIRHGQNLKNEILTIMMDCNVLLDDLIERYPQLSSCKDDIRQAYSVMSECYCRGSKLLVCGNGGSAADAEHIVGELMKGFKCRRRLDEGYATRLRNIGGTLGGRLAEGLQGALPAIALDGHPALSTAYMNDCDPQLSFAQQVSGYGKPGDVLMAISTSGNSRNVVYAAVTAKAKDMVVIGLTGGAENRLSDWADVCIRVPETETFKVQELHLPVYHCLCLMLENEFFADE